MLPDLLSPLESCYQHGTEWLLLPRWQKPSACPLAAGHISEGSDASSGNASPNEPWEEKSTSMVNNCLQRNKSFFKNPLSLFTNSGLRFSVAVRSTQAWPRKPQRSSTNCHLSRLRGSGGERMSPRLKASVNQKGFPVKLSQGLATFPEVGTLSVSACCWDTLWWDTNSICCGNERKILWFHCSTIAYYILQRSLSWNSPSLPPHLNTLGRATLNLSGFGLTLHEKKPIVPHSVHDLVTQAQPWDAASVDKA